MRPLAISAVAFAAVSGLLLWVWVQQRRLIYFPFGTPPPPAAVALAAAEPVEFPTEDGLRLAGWFVPPPRPDPRATVIVFNGNAGNRADRATLAAGLVARDLAVLLFDYRGYGGNPGRPSEDGLVRDARAARRWLLSRPGVRPERLAYFGESLGAAVAVALASEAPPAWLLLRSPFTSLADVGRAHYPFLPVNLMLRDRFPSIERIGALEVPLLVVAGSADRIVPFEQSRALYDAAGSRRKRFIAIDGADHNDLALAAGPGLLDEVAAFLREEGP
jgi:fermentation-respiration switch protein FrsA (DUF1100 family)